MAGFCTDLPILYLSRVYTLAGLRTYDAATGMFSTTLKIDWVTHGKKVKCVIN